MSNPTVPTSNTARKSVARSVQLEAQIIRLQALRYKAQNKEARLRCHAIFGEVPRGYCLGREESLGAVARVYVIRAYRQNVDGLAEHEWIRRWHELSKLPVKELIEIADDYIAGGCGISG